MAEKWQEKGTGMVEGLQGPMEEMKVRSAPSFLNHVREAENAELGQVARLRGGHQHLH